MKFEPVQQEIPQVKPLLKRQTRGKKPVSKNTQRWVVTLVFIFTVLASAGFWLKTEIPKFWQKIATPTIISTLPKEKQFDPSPVLKEFDNLTKDLRGAYGLYVYELKTNREYGVRQNEIFPAASLMKLPVILALYQEAEAGQVRLENEYKLIQADIRMGAGILQAKPLGGTYTYRQLAEFMGHYSDNTAFTALIRILGAAKIQQTIKQVGMSKTSLNEHETSPADIGLFFKKLYQDSLVNRTNQGEILRFLTKTAYEDWIPAGIPSDIRVAHKIGKDTGIFSDGGIIFREKPFVLVVMSKNARENEAIDALPKITKAVWEWEERDK